MLRKIDTLVFLQILYAFQNDLVYFLYLYKTIIQVLKVKINLKVGCLLVVYYEECDFNMFMFCIISSYKCFSADMKYHSHAEWSFLMLYFYEYKIRVFQKLLLKTRQWFQTQIDISQTKRVVLVKFEIQTVKIYE